MEIFPTSLYSKLRTNPQLMRFVLAGTANTFVHLIIFAALETLNTPLALANVLAFLCANIFSFFVASYFVFKVNKSNLYFYWRFLGLSIIGVVISYSISAICRSLQVNPYISVLGVVLVIPPISYALQRFAFYGRSLKSFNDPSKLHDRQHLDT